MFFDCKIDAATGAKETNASVLSRSIRLAKSFRKLGFRPGDILALGGINHLDLYIPYYAALMNGLPVVGVDPLYKADEIKTLFTITEPKLAFCQYASYMDFKQVVDDLGLSTKIITFDVGECTFNNVLELCEEDDREEFSPASFDLDKMYAWLLTTSGTSGVPKVAAFKHRHLIKAIHSYRQIRLKPFLALNLSPIQWISAFLNGISMTYNSSRVQSSAPTTIEHIIDIINEYKPGTAFFNPNKVFLILNHEKDCDFTCFDIITLGGTKVHENLLMKLKSKVREDTEVVVGYGQTETFGLTLNPNPEGPIGNCGTAFPNLDVKLVDPETEQDISDANVPGELWCKGDLLFSEYYNNPEETEKAFSEDGWYKTGDLLYKDENSNYFFVDRLKMLIKYQSYRVTPLELEDVIMQHEGVLDVCVTGIPHQVDRERPVACVVRRPGSDVTAQEIKDLVADNLPTYKHLTGGVVFVNELPMTSTGKVARIKVQYLVMGANKE